jgi:4-hydroxy-tetrahydrodipicolinate synthase
LATKKYEEFGLYDAYMVHAVDSLISGSAGLSCIQGNYFPELVVWLCNNYDKEELGTDVKIIQKFFAENMDLMHDNYPTSAKYTLGKRNLTINEYCRTVKKELDEHTRLDLDQLYDEFSLLCEKLGIDTNYIRM